MKHVCTGALGLLALSLLAAYPAHAQTVPPTAGETLRELQQQSRQPAPRANTELIVPADADASADAGQKFPVESVVLEGNVQVPTAVLQPLLDPLAHREVSLGELRQAAAAITAVYRERGFVVARAFVPAQALKDGVLRIAVLEGRMSSSRVANGSDVRADVLEGILKAQALDGRIIQSQQTDRALLLMADLPGVGKVSGNLRPGAEVGTSDLVVDVRPGRSIEGEVSVDNYGNRYTGQDRVNGHVAFDSPFGIGDRIDLRATTTDHSLWYGRAAYDLPLNADGLRGGVNVSSSSYSLGREFANLDAHGTADTAGVYGSYPLLRGLNGNVWLAGALDGRRLKDDVDSTSTSTHKDVGALTLETYGDFSDAFAGGAFSTWHVTAVAGDLKIRTAAAHATDAAGPRTAGSYQKLGLTLTRLQAVTETTSVWASLSGQAASKNLDSSEKFVIGGIYGVRAYPQGEGAGDDGMLGTIELRQTVLAGIDASAFYDAGHVSFNHAVYSAAANTQTLKGYGLGLGVHSGGFVARATLAWRDGQPAVTAPDRDPRIWLMAGWAF